MKRSFTPLLALLFLLALTLTACQPATTPPPPSRTRILKIAPRPMLAQRNEP